VDARSDIYSLAGVLFEMLAGTPAFAGSNARAVIARRLTEPPPSVRALRPDVPAALIGNDIAYPAMLTFLPVGWLGLMVAGALTRTVGSALRVTTAVASYDPDDPESRQRSDALLEAAGFSTRGSGSIGAVSRFLTRATMLGTFGGVTGVIVLLGLALPGFILAWRVRFGDTFRALASAAWLMAATLGSLVGLGVL